MFYKYFLPVCDLSFHFLNSTLPRGEVFKINKVEFFNFFSFIDHIFGVVSKKSSLNPGSSRLPPMSSFRSYIILILHLGL